MRAMPPPPGAAVGAFLEMAVGPCVPVELTQQLRVPPAQGTRGYTRCGVNDAFPLHGLPMRPCSMHAHTCCLCCVPLCFSRQLLHCCNRTTTTTKMMMMMENTMGGNEGAHGERRWIPLGRLPQCAPPPLQQQSLGMVTPPRNDLSSSTPPPPPPPPPPLSPHLELRLQPGQLLVPPCCGRSGPHAPTPSSCSRSARLRRGWSCRDS